MIWCCLTLKHIFCTKLTELGLLAYSSVVSKKHQWRNKMPITTSCDLKLLFHHIPYIPEKAGQSYQASALRAQWLCVYYQRPTICKDTVNTVMAWPVVNKSSLSGSSGSTEYRRLQTCSPGVVSNRSTHSGTRQQTYLAQFTKKKKVQIYNVIR